MGFPDTKEGLEQQIAEQRAFLSTTDGATDDETLRDRAYALWTIGEDLMRLERFQEASIQHNEAAAAFWPFGDDRHVAVHARCRQAAALAALGRNEDAVALLDAVVEEIGLDWDPPSSSDAMPHLLDVWMQLLRDLGSVDRAEDVADVVLRRVRYGTTPVQRLAIVHALRQKALGALSRGGFTEAIAFLDELIERGLEERSGEFDAEFASAIASGLVLRAFAYERSGDPEQALADCDQALTRFGGASGAGIEGVLADARGRRFRLRVQVRFRRALRLG